MRISSDGKYTVEVVVTAKPHEPFLNPKFIHRETIKCASASRRPQDIEFDAVSQYRRTFIDTEVARASGVSALDFQYKASLAS